MSGHGALGGVVWQEGGQENVTDAALPAPQNLGEISDIALQEKNLRKKWCRLRDASAHFNALILASNSSLKSGAASAHKVMSMPVSTCMR